METARPSGLGGLLPGLAAEQLSLRCTRCQATQPIAAERASEFRQSQVLYAELQAGQIAQEEFDARLRELEIVEYVPSTNAEEGWRCPSCQSEVPAGYLTCWSCGHELPVAGETGEKPPLPKINLGGGYAWEEEEHP